MAYDVIIRRANVVDGTGRPPRHADVAIQDGLIAAVDDLRSAQAAVTINASGRVVCPGFIDIHGHSDVSMFDDPGAESKVHQGITTDVVGNCGQSPFPCGKLDPADLQRVVSMTQPGSQLAYDWRDLDGWAQALEGSGISLNVVPQVGHNTLRLAAGAVENRPANSEELECMKRLVSEAVEQGAVALTTALTGPPAMHASPEEIATLAAEAGRYEHAFYASHARLLAGWHFDAVDEAIAVGQLTGIPVQYSHIAIIDLRHHGGSAEMVGRMEEARSHGVDVRYDVYPYTAGAAGVSSVMPLWAQEGGVRALLARLDDPTDRKRIANELGSGFWGGIPLPWDKYVITKSTKESLMHYVGWAWTDIAADRGKSPVDALIDIAREDVFMEGVLHVRSEDDVRYFLQHPLSMIGSDGTAMAPDGLWRKTKPHPRTYGCYPRILGRYVREYGLLSLEEAVKKMTSDPADRLGIATRGRVSPGKAADLVVFDPDVVLDRATWEDPHCYPTGISDVFVNGVRVVENGTHTQVRPGRVLRRGLA